jgi:hypothetical protein
VKEPPLHTTHTHGNLLIKFNEKNCTSVTESVDGDSHQVEYPDQQLSLLALHRLGLVPEHVETRSLYSSLQPQIEQVISLCNVDQAEISLH